MPSNMSCTSFLWYLSFIPSLRLATKLIGLYFQRIDGCGCGRVCVYLIFDESLVVEHIVAAEMHSCYFDE